MRRFVVGKLERQCVIVVDQIDHLVDNHSVVVVVVVVVVVIVVNRSSCGGCSGGGSGCCAVTISFGTAGCACHRFAR